MDHYSNILLSSGRIRYSRKVESSELFVRIKSAVPFGYAELPLKNTLHVKKSTGEVASYNKDRRGSVIYLLTTKADVKRAYGPLASRVELMIFHEMTHIYQWENKMKRFFGIHDSVREEFRRIMRIDKMPSMAGFEWNGEGGKTEYLAVVYDFGGREITEMYEIGSGESVESDLEDIISREPFVTRGGGHRDHMYNELPWEAHALKTEKVLAKKYFKMLDVDVKI